MKRSAFLVLAATAIFLSGCMYFPVVTGSGTPATAVYGVGGFSGIQASQSFKVRVIPDAAYSVSVTCDDNLTDYLVVQTSTSGTLRLSLAQGYSYQLVTLTAIVHMPVLTLLDGSGASSFDVRAGFSSARPLAISLSGASTANVAGLVCGDLGVDLSGASTATVTGSPATERLSADGASKADLMNCTGAGADVALDGASEAWVNVGAGAVSLHASGASTFYYGGAPSFTTCDLSGASRTVKVQ